MGLEIEKLNGKRQLLAPKLPLSQPYSISVTTANICNLRCEYCSVSDKSHPKNKSLLELDTYKRLIDSMHECGWHIKQIVLVGLGEPFLNASLPEFVRYAKKMDVADKINIVTNGTMMSKQVIDELIEADLDVLRVSVNGLSEADYEKYTGKRIDFIGMVESIRYFYEKKNESTKIYIKIMDYMVKTEDAKRKFRNIFQPISDVCNIEYLTRMSTTMDYASITKIDDNTGLKGFASSDVIACPLPFYHIYFNAEGTVSACCVAGPWSTPPALQMGSIYEETIEEIWKGKRFTSFLMDMLKLGRKEVHPVCKECKAYLSYVYPEDNIDKERETILSRMEKEIY